MGTTYYPSKDAELNAWLDNFIHQANGNLAALGLIAGDITPISTAQTTYTGNYLDVEAKKAALASAVETKDASKDSIIQKVRVVVNKIQANPAVTPALKALLGISTHQGGSSPLHPVEPTELIANILPDGAIELDWSRNGNGANTQFVIEFNVANAGWKLLDIVTQTTFIHRGQPIGQQIQYIVKARKAGETSGASNIAMVG